MVGIQLEAILEAALDVNDAKIHAEDNPGDTFAIQEVEMRYEMLEWLIVRYGRND